MENKASPPRVLLWGGRSAARIADAMLKEGNLGITAIIFDCTLERPQFETTALFINNPEKLKEHLSRVSHYVTCIGGEHGYARYVTSQYLERAGLKPLSLIHEKSYVESTSVIGKGCHLMPFSLVHKFCQVGDYALLNTRATIDHECVIGDGVHVMGSAAMAGRVEVGNFATIGTNATILPSIKIGEGAYVGAGAVVTKEVAPYTLVVGVPAKPIKTLKPGVALLKPFLDS